jgi:cytidylate kinase
MSVTLDQVKADLIERDRRDTQRPLSPLILTEGTIHIDNSDMTIDEEVDLMYRTIKGDN